MGGIAGLVHWGGTDNGDAEQLANGIRHRGDRIVARTNGPATFLATWRATTPWAEHEDQPIVGDKAIFVCDARLDDRFDEEDDVSDAQVVFAKLMLDQIKGIDSLLGDFATACWDSERKVLFLARDFLGHRPLYYAVSSMAVAFASEPASLLSLPWVDRRPDLEWILDWQSGMWGCPTNTFHAGIKQVPPATVLRFEAGTTRQFPYWDPFQIPVDDAMTEVQASEGFLHHFKRAVKDRTPATGPIAAQLSGGLDSSGVAALASSYAPNLKSYSMVFDETSECDEREYLQSFLDANGSVAPHFVPSDRHGPWWALTERVGWMGGPVKSFHSSFLMGLIRQAGNDGIQVMLNGSEGDLTVGHGEYYGIDLLRSGRVGELKTYLESSPSKKSMTNKFLNKVALPASQGLTVPLARVLLGRYESRRPDHSMGGPVPREWTAVYRRRLDQYFPTARISIRSDAHAHRLGFNQGLVAEILRMIEHAHAHSGLEARTPFFDRRLVEFSLTVPSRHRVRGNKSRYFYREAMKDYLPAKILRRTGKTSFRLAFEKGLQEAEPNKAIPNPFPTLLLGGNPYGRLRVAMTAIALERLRPPEELTLNA